MNTIEKTVSERYQNSSNLILLIRKYELEEVLDEILNRFESLMIKSDEKEISELAAISLTKINEVLKNIISEEKQQLEYLLSDIFLLILSEIDSSQMHTKIQKSLLNACNIAGYDYEALEQMLGLGKQEFLKQKSDNRDLPYYDWKGLDYELQALLDYLRKKEIIMNKKEFRKLFSPVSCRYSYKASSERINELMLIFSILNEINLLKPKRTSGHFVPLAKYGIDNQGKFLFEKRPNKIHEYLKRDKDAYNRKRRKYEKIIKEIAAKTLGQ